MKKISITLIMLLVVVAIFPTRVHAISENIVYLSNDKITVNGTTITNNDSSDIYLSNKMDNGGRLEEATNSNIEINNIININKAGTYEFTGILTDGQISVDANQINGNVNIILNNVSITCKSAPAIFIYCKDVENENCKVTITLKENSVNTIIGGKIKQSVENWSDQDSILYYIDKGYDDNRQYYERYKYDGAISSDISLIFEGNGILNVTSTKKEGIESKMNLTFNGGTYNINTVDDGINASADNKSAITINDGKILVKVSSEAEEGDGIDSNGSIIINGGTIYTFACPGSDNGLDSDNGITINGGTILSTGDMAEELKSSNNTKIVQMSFSKQIEAGETILIVDENENAIFAYKTDRKLSTFAYSSEKLENKDYLVYVGTDIEGTLDENNIYTEITNFNLSRMTKQENTGMQMGQGFPMNDRENFNMQNNDKETRVILTILIVLIILLVITVSIYCYTEYKRKRK